MSNLFRVLCTSIALFTMSAAVPVTAKDKTPAMTALQIQSLQTHDFEGTKEDVFGSVVSVLQDSGYRIQSGDIQTGLITAIGSSKGKLTYNIFTGFGKSKKSPMVTAYIEQIGSVTRVRLNFVMASVKSSGYGMQPQDEEPVLDAAVYKDAFEKMEQALFVRTSMRTTSSPAPNSQKADAATPAPVQTPAGSPPN